MVMSTHEIEKSEKKMRARRPVGLQHNRHFHMRADDAFYADLAELHHRWPGTSDAEIVRRAVRHVVLAKLRLGE
jgi:hypothetical protein